VSLKYHARGSFAQSSTEFSRRAFIHCRSFSFHSLPLSPLAISFPLSTRLSSIVEDRKRGERKDMNLFLSLSLSLSQPVITWSTQNGRIITLDPLFVCGFCPLNLYSCRFSCALFFPTFLVLSSVCYLVFHLEPVTSNISFYGAQYPPSTRYTTAVLNLLTCVHAH